MFQSRIHGSWMQEVDENELVEISYETVYLEAIDM